MIRSLVTQRVGKSDCCANEGIGLALSFLLPGVLNGSVLLIQMGKLRSGDPDKCGGEGAGKGTGLRVHGPPFRTT